MQKITSKPYYHDCCKNYQKLENKIPYLLFFQDHESDDTRNLKIVFTSNIYFSSGEGKHSTKCILTTIL